MSEPKIYRAVRCDSIPEGVRGAESFVITTDKGGSLFIGKGPIDFVNLKLYMTAQARIAELEKEVQSKTEAAKHFMKCADGVVEDKVLIEKENSRLKERLERTQKWAYFYQLRKVQGLAGQAFTSFVCAACDKEDTYHNTNVPIFCEECTDKIKAKLKSEVSNERQSE